MRVRESIVNLSDDGRSGRSEMQHMNLHKLFVLMSGYKRDEKKKQDNIRLL